MDDYLDRYWGTNAVELQSIKATYDPDYVFTCHNCVADAAL
jgi:hypothetical protein